MLAPQVAVASFAALGEGGVVVLQAVDPAVVGDADEQRAAVGAVGEPGDRLHDRVLDVAGLLALVDVPAHRRLVLEGPGLAVGMDQLADRTRPLTRHPGLRVDARRAAFEPRRFEVGIVQDRVDHFVVGLLAFEQLRLPDAVEADPEPLEVVGPGLDLHVLVGDDGAVDLPEEDGVVLGDAHREPLVDSSDHFRKRHLFNQRLAAPAAGDGDDVAAVGVEFESRPTTTSPYGGG